MNRPVRRVDFLPRAIDAGARHVREQVRLARVQGGGGLRGCVLSGGGRVAGVGVPRGGRHRRVSARGSGVRDHGRRAPGAGVIDVHLVEAASEGRPHEPE